MTSPHGRKIEAGDRGVTLPELLVVMGLLALLVGLSVGAFGKLTQTYDLPASASAVRSLLLRARNTAREEGYPTVVEIDAAAREVRAYVRSWVAIWHFEEGDKEQGTNFSDFDTDGAFGNYGQVYGAKTDDEGKVGTGLSFGFGGYMDAGEHPTFNPTDGVVLEAYIKTNDLSPAITTGSNGGVPLAEEVNEYMVICKGRFPPEDPYDFSYFLRVTSDYAVEAGVKGPPDSNEDDGVYIVSTYPGAFEPGRWTKVAMTYDGRRISIRVHGVPRGVKVRKVAGKKLACPDRLERRGGYLYVSHPDRSFDGSIDEVRVGMIHSPERARYRLPGNVAFLIPGDAYADSKTLSVRFDPLGRLDPIHHVRPMEIVLTDAEGYGPGDRVVREVQEAEDKRRKKRRRPTGAERRTRTKDNLPTISEKAKITITIDLSGNIR